MKKNNPKLRPIIGWREYLQLPDLGIEKIKAKIDSGARTSALHAYRVRIKEIKDEDWVYFKVHPNQKDNQTSISCKAKIFTWKNIKSSNGEVEERPIIKTSINFFQTKYIIELSLTSRLDMGFRMLLGREALKNRFLIDSGRSFLADKSNKTKNGDFNK